MPPLLVWIENSLPRQSGLTLWSSLVDSSILDDDGIEERHRLAEFGADFFDLVAALFGTEGLELLAAGVLVRNEALGEFAALDVCEHVLHGLLGLGRDD